MALAERAQLIASLDLVDNLSPGLAKAETSLVRMGGVVDTAAKKAGGLTGAFGSLAAGFAGGAGFALVDRALSSVVDTLGNAVKAATEEETSIAALNSSLKANAEAWDGNTAAIEKTIASRTRLGFSDDEQRASLARLVAATHDVNDALELQRAAMDLAAFKHISLGEAGEALIRIEGGQFRALKSLIGATNDIKTSEQALAAVHAATEGAAEDLANTTAGKLAAANIAVGEAMEKIGTSLLPFAVQGANAIATVAEAAADAVGDIEQFVDIVGNIVTEADRIRQENSDGWRIPIVAEGIDLVTGAFGRLQSTNQDFLTRAVATSQAMADQAVEAADLTRAHLIASEAADDHRAKQEALAAATENSLGTFNGWTIQVGQAGAALTILGATTATVADVTNDSTSALSAEAAALDRVAFSAAVAARNLAAVGTASIAADAAERTRLRNLGETGGIVPGGLVGGGGTTVQPGVQNQDLIDQVAEAGRIADEAARRAAENKRRRDTANHAAADQAKKDAAEIAAANRDKVANSYDVAKRGADRLFDSLHDRHIKAIKDAETLAEKQHDAAVQNINDTLAAQKVANAAPVTAAEKAQGDTEASRQRRNLIESVQAAQQALATNRDQTRALDLQRSLRDATESLQSFDANRAIDRLKGAQAIQDQAAENAAKIARDKADADLEAAKTKAAADEKFVNTRDAKRKADFDTALAALRKRDEGSPAKFLTDLKQLQTKFGIFTDERGFTHIGDVVADAITKAKPPTVNVTLAVPRGAIQLNGRDVNNAVTVGISPTQSQSARSGNARPRT